MDREQLFEVTEGSHDRPRIVGDAGAGGGLVAGVERAIDQRMASVPVEVSESLGVRVRAALEAVGDRTTGAMEGVRSAVSGVEERITGHLEALSRSVDGLPAGVKDSLAAALAGLRDDLEVMHALPKQIARVLQVVREAVGAIAESQESLGGRVEGVEAGFDERMRRIDTLAGAIESLAKRRGFKDLIRSEQAAAEQQETYVRQLVELGRRLGERLEALEASAALRGQVTEDLEGIRRDLGIALEDLRDRLAAELASGFVGIRGGAGTGSESNAQLLQEMRAARADLDRVRARMDSWGHARSAPRLAQEVAGLGERVEAVERVVQEELTDAVFERMQQHLDRRFEALVRLIESRVAALAPDDEDPRARSRRR